MEQQQTLQLIDIYDISYNPWWLSLWFKFILIIFAVALAGAIGYFFYHKYRKKPVIPYWQQALNKLHQLSKTDFQDGQLFYLQLTDILKQYLQERYQIHFVDKTDTELLKALKDDTTEIPLSVYETVKELLDGVMVIKFAHGQAVQERMNTAIAQSILLIESTYRIDNEKEVH